MQSGIYEFAQGNFSSLDNVKLNFISLLLHKEITIHEIINCTKTTFIQFNDKMCEEMYDTKFSDIGSNQCL